MAFLTLRFLYSHSPEAFYCLERTVKRSSVFQLAVARKYARSDITCRVYRYSGRCISSKCWSAQPEKISETIEARLDPALYVVGTPIGNLEDISFRALKILKGVDRILCEDTRRTGALLHHFEIKAKTESFHVHNEFRKVNEILEFLGKGQSVAIVSDAGMPTINDPGGQLIRHAIVAGVKIVPIPGPSAFLSALVASGLMHDTFIYCGFIEAKSSRRLKQFESWKDSESTLIFYVSPHALPEALQDAFHVFGNRGCCLAREITKLHEEFMRESLQTVCEEYKERKPRGEYTLLIEGRTKVHSAVVSDDDIVCALRNEIELGSSPSAAAKIVSKELELPRKRVYELSLRIK